MSAQAYAPSSSRQVDADGTITFIDSNGDTVQMAASGNSVFHGLRHAGGEGFVSSDEESSDEEPHQHAHFHQPPPPMYAAGAYAPAVSSSKKEKKEKKEKKSKKSKKERSPEYMAAPIGSASVPHGACSCGHGRH